MKMNEGKFRMTDWMGINEGNKDDWVNGMNEGNKDDWVNGYEWRELGWLNEWVWKKRIRMTEWMGMKKENKDDWMNRYE